MVQSIDESARSLTPLDTCDSRGCHWLIFIVNVFVFVFWQVLLGLRSFWSVDADIGVAPFGVTVHLMEESNRKLTSDRG